MEHMVAQPREANPEPHACIVLLHGLGSSEQDLFGMVPELPKQPLVVSVRAPYPMPYGGWFWYALGNDIAVPDPGTLKGAVEQLRAFLVDLPSRYPVDPARLYLLGFSQGAVMAGLLLTQEPKLIAGAAILSGYIPEPDGGPPPDVAGKPVFIAHGSQDEVVPVVLGRQARLRLEGWNAAVDYHEYPMGHQASLEELRDLTHWFERLGIR